MGVYSNTASGAYADKIKAVYECLDAIRKVADRLTPVEDLTSFQAQIEALYAQLDLLVEASNTILGMTPTGEAILTGTVASIKTLLEIGVLPPDVVTQAELDAALAALELRLGDRMTAVETNVSETNLIVDQLDQYRLSQQTKLDGLELNYQNLATGQQSQQTQLDSMLSRLVVQEDTMVLVDQHLTSIDQSVANTTTGLQATNSTVAGHTASISDLSGSIQLHTASIDQLTSDLVNTNNNVAAHTSAIDTMQTTITGFGDDLTAQSQQTTALKSVIGGSGNLLPNSDFGASNSGWQITVAEEDWANTVLTVDTFNMPPEVHCLEVLGQPSPFGQIVVQSPAVLIEENHYYMVSGYPCVDNGTATLSYKAFNNAGVLLDQKVCPITANPTTNTNIGAYTRTWVHFQAPVGATKLHLYLTVTGDGDFTTQGALFRPMVERSWAEQTQPSAWTPNVSGVPEALSTAVQGLETQVSQIDGELSALSTSFTALESEVHDPSTGLAATSSALSSLTTEVNQNGLDIQANATAITQLAVGAGEQFDSKRIWYFDTDLESWTGSTGTSVASGYVTPGASTTPYLRSPLLAGTVDGTKYKQLKAKIRKVGAPTWRGWLRWITETDQVYDSVKQVTIPAPTFDTDGDATIDFKDVPWPANLRQVQLYFSTTSDASNYVSADWIAIGRSSPGASVASVSDEIAARVSADNAEASARQALEATVNDPNTGLAKAHSRITTEETTRANADSALSSRVNTVEARMPAGTGQLATSASVSDEATARVNGDNANAQSIQNLQTTVNGNSASITTLSRVTASANDNGGVGLLDPSFERTDGWGTSTTLDTPNTTFPANIFYQTGTTADYTHTGVRALRFSAGANGSVANNSWMRVTPGRKYRVTYWYRSWGTVAAGSYVRMSVRRWKPDGTFVNYSVGGGQVDFTGAAGPAYTKVSFIHTVPAGDGIHQWNVQASVAAGGGSIMVDDVTVELVPEETAAMWSMTMDVNNYISGVYSTNNGTLAQFNVLADVFKVLKPGGGAALTWENGILWNKGTMTSVILGQNFGATSDLLLWAGANPASAAAASKTNGVFWIDKNGTAYFGGDLRLGTLHTKEQHNQTATNWNVAGTFVTVHANSLGHSKTLVVNAALATTEVSSGNTVPSHVAKTATMRREVRRGSTVLHTEDKTSTSAATYDVETNTTTIAQSWPFSNITYTDTSTATGDITYEVRYSLVSGTYYGPSPGTVIISVVEE